MLRDFKFLRRNSGKIEEIENVPVNPTDSSSNMNNNVDSSRAPLNAIPDPTQNPKLTVENEVSGKNKVENEVVGKSKFERTPIKAKGKTSDALRTPERQGYGGRNRFGFSSVNEGREEMSSYLSQSSRHGNGTSSLNLTPRVGRTNSEVNSTQTTPTKSVSKPPNPAYTLSSSRHLGNGSARAGSYAALSRGFSGSTVQPCVVNTVDVSHFDLKEDPSFWMDHNVQVIIRVRPLSGAERSTYGYSRCVRQDNAQSITWIGQPESRFTFDHVACETVDQEMLFRMAGRPMIENCLSGYNSCMFAYGQTGSGKTYTMLGEMEDVEFKPSSHRGMTPRIFEYLFARIRAEEESRRDEKLKYSCKCSFLEIYNEQITDLLDPSSTNLLLREDVKKGVYVENLSEFEVHTVGDVLRLLIQGSSNRKVAATNMNRESSRSHCVFICIIESKWERDSVINLRFARLNLVDLAGSERQKSSGAEGERLKEAANINKSLSTLGHVIMLLVDIAHGKPRHVPYRDSRLTFLLQDSLGGNSKTMIIANVSPSICCAAETLNTLKFAQRAKLIQNNAVVNEDTSGDVAVLQHQIWLLKEELSALKHNNVSRTLAFDPSSTTRGEENYDREYRSENDLSKAENLLDSEAKGSVQVSSKQLKSMEMMLAGALRREQMAEDSIKQLEAELEQLNRLVRQREEDSKCTKMMLKFREDKIHRMESRLGDLKPVDAYLLEENAALSEEIQMLRAKVDRNPEVTRFAKENIRLLEQLRKYQDFYEEGERDLLMNEVSELRGQLIRLLDTNSQQQNHGYITQEVASNGKENESLRYELNHTMNELAECQSKLKSCLETNAKLCRQIEELHSQSRNKDSEIHGCHGYFNALKEMQIPDSGAQAFEAVDDGKCGTKLRDMATHAEEIVNLELELDILNIILKEERLSRGKMEEAVSSLSRDVQRAEERVLLISKQCEDARLELEESKSVIEALESQQLLSITEMEDLKNSNSQYLELLRKQEVQISVPREQTYGQKSTSCLRHSECEESPLQEQLKRMQASLDKAKRLNMWYQSDHAFQKSSEEEKDEIRRQAEAETAEVIVCLQEELSILQQRVEESDLREKDSERRLLTLETKLGELQKTIDMMSHDSEVLRQNLQEKDTKITSLTEDWELLSHEIEKALIEGHEALKSASDQIDSASSLNRRVWISEQMGKMIRQISDKESIIEDLNNCLEDANSKANDMERMLLSLRGAAMAMTESHQQECYVKEQEILQLRSELTAHLSAEKEDISMSEKKGLEDMQTVRNGVLNLQAVFSDFEKQCESKILALSRKLNKVDEYTQEAKCSWRQTKEVLEFEVVDAKATTAQKAVEASCLLAKFEEIQDTMKEADVMINGLMIANETLKFEIEDLRNTRTELTGERNSLVNELHVLQAANELNDQKCKNLEKQFELDASKTVSLIEELQGLISLLQDTSEEAIVLLTQEFNCIKSQLQSMVRLMHSSLEDIWSDVLMKDCALSVFHLCHMGVLLEAAVGLNAENGLLHHGLSESNALICDLKDDNRKATQELEMFQETKGKLLSDIKSSFDLISSKEGETRELNLKLNNFKEKLVVLQHQEELMLERSNVMGSELAMLMEELVQNNSTVITSLAEKEKLLKSSDELIKSQSENFEIEFYGKDLQLLVLASELQQVARHSAEMETRVISLQTRVEEIKDGETKVMAQLGTLEAENKSLREHLSLLEKDMEIKKTELHDFQQYQSAQTEDLEIELFENDLDQLILASELQQLAHHTAHMETVLTHFRTLEADNKSLREHLSKKDHDLVEMEKLLKSNAEMVTIQGENSEIELYEKDLEVLILASELQQSAHHNADMDTNVSIQIRSLEAENKSLREHLGKKDHDLVEKEKLLKRNDEMITSQGENSEIELYGKDLELLMLASELQQLAHHSAEMDTNVIQLQTLEAENNSLREHLTKKDHDVENLQNGMLLLQSSSHNLQNKMTMMEEENETLQNKLLELKSENCVLIKDFQAKDAEYRSSLGFVDTLKFQNSSLKENVSTLESRIASLEEDLEIRKTELDDFQHLRTSTAEELSNKSQDLDSFAIKLNALQEENLILRDEVLSLKQRNLDALRTLSLQVAQCAHSMEVTDTQCSVMLKHLEEKIILVLDQLSEDSCQNLNVVSGFSEELDFVDYIAKELVSQNSSLQEELLRKDEVLNGLLFDLRLLQESAANSKDQKAKIEELEVILESTESELATRSHELDEAINYGKVLDAKAKEQGGTIPALERDLEVANQSINMLSHENMMLRSNVEDNMAARTSVERELNEKSSRIDSLENELLEMGNTLGQMNDLVESLKSNLDDINSERDNLQKELVMLEGKVDTAYALAEENEAIAAEAQEIAESRRMYAEEKEEEVQLLERSVQELDSTISVLENKVDALKGEAERQRLQREELELELHSLKNQMHTVENTDADIKRHLDEKARNLREALVRVEVLEKDLAHRDTEIAQCKAHISELTLHAEAQACEYKQKFKELEAMVEQVKSEEACVHERVASYSKLEKNPTKGRGSASPFKARGSGSPFKCIGLGLVHQLKSEKDEELNADRVRIEELEALAESRLKENFALKAKLAASESMAHDVLRDMLGVKLNINDCANQLDKQQISKITKSFQLHSIESQDQEVIKLKEELNEFIEERQGWLEELDRRRGEFVAAQIALEQHRQQEQFLNTENEVLKKEIAKHKKQVIELEGEVKKLSGQQNLQQRIHHHAKIKEENSVLKIQNEDLSSRLRRAESYLLRVREELAHYRARNGRIPHNNFDVEQRLNNHLEESERENLHLAQTLLGLCTSILKAAGVTKPTSEINLSAAEEALEQLCSRIVSLERELEDSKVKNKIISERLRLAELKQDSSPYSARSDENRQSLRTSQSPFLSTFDR